MPIVDVPRTITTKSASPAKFDGPAKPGPMIAATVGTQPESRVICRKKRAPSAKWALSSPSWMRCPPPSSSSTSGQPCSSACSASRASLCPPTRPFEPPSTV